MRPEKKFKPVRDLNPWPLRYQCNDLPTDRVDKPAGSLSLCWFVINPWSDESMAVHIWKYLRNEYESDPCIDENYSSNSESKAWKKFRPVRYLNPWPLRYRVYFEQQLTVNIYTYIYKHLNFDFIAGIGWASVIIVQFLNIYYIVILGWALFYMFASFRSELPWSRCGNEWNTPNCVDYVTSEKGSSNTTVLPTVMASMSNMSTVPTAVAKAANVSASEEYFEWVKL